MHLNIIIVEYPQSGTTVNELFDGIAKGVLRAHEKGGNQTISYIRK